MKYLLSAIGLIYAVQLFFIFNPSLAITPIKTMGLLSILFLPGLSILILLKQRIADFWLILIHSLALSVVYIFALGLALSLLLPPISLNRPLDANIFAVFFYPINFCLLFIAYVLFPNSRLEVSQVKNHITNLFLLFTSIAFAFISIIGAFKLNSGYSNLTTLSWLFVSAFAYFLSTIAPNKTIQKYQPFFIFNLSLSFLWALSARSWHIAGWDIVQEYFVAQITQSHGLWEMDLVRDAYNACLSITILPTVLSNLTGLSIESLYKYVYPFLFAHFTVCIYYWLNKLTNSTFSALAVFYIIAQSFFIQPMVALARQEIAFLFFALLINTIYSVEIKGKARVLLISAYVFGLVTSHYSTTYVSVAIFLSAWIGISLVYLMKRVPLPVFLTKFDLYKRLIQDYTSPLNGWIVFLLLLTTFIWYFVITGVGNGLTLVLQENLKNLPALMSGEQRSQEAQLAVSGRQSVDVTTQSDLQFFEQTNSVGLSNLTEERQKSISSLYLPRPLFETLVSPDIPLGLAQTSHRALSWLKESLKYLVMLGCIFLMIRMIQRKPLHLDLIIFSSLSSLILFIMLFHPTISLKYNVSRIYLQLLVFLSIGLVISLDTLLLFFQQKIRVVISSAVILLTLFYLQGLVVPFIGGVPFMFLFNAGTDYEKFMVYRGELASANWLGTQRDKQDTVYGDELSVLRLRKETTIFPNKSIIPAVLANDADSYVYLTYANKVLQKTRVTFNGKSLLYEYPTRYLDENRNLIYSNNTSAIYK